MSIRYAKQLVIAVALAAGVSGGVGIAAASTAHSAARPGPISTSGPASSKVWTPNDCVRLNGGDYIACNVGNSGRGDRPYRPVHVK